MPAVFDQSYVKRLKGTHVKQGKTKMDLADQLRKDLQNFRTNHGISRLVMIWCGSTEVYIKPGSVHRSVENFEKGLQENDPGISPSMIYAYAALDMGIPYANGAPNLCNMIPAMWELADKNKVPMGGRDFKTGQRAAG